MLSAWSYWIYSWKKENFPLFFCHQWSYVSILFYFAKNILASNILGTSSVDLKLSFVHITVVAILFSKTLLIMRLVFHTTLDSCIYCGIWQFIDCKIMDFIFTKSNFNFRLNSVIVMEFVGTDRSRFCFLFVLGFSPKSRF